MSENTSTNPLVADPETGKLKRCCSMTGDPLKQCSGGGSGGTVTFCEITAVPALGYGLTTVRDVVVDEFGNYTLTGEPYPVIIPKSYRY